jgi:hypothetical protein
LNTLFDLRKGLTVSAETYRRLADVVAIAHVLVLFNMLVAFVVIAMGATALPLLFWIEVGFVLSTLVSQRIFRGCPLTILERKLRLQYDPNYPNTRFIVRIKDYLKRRC